MNDNILTEHPKLAVEYCLEYRRLGGDQTIKPGDWYYDLSFDKPKLKLSRNESYEILNDELLAIPTLSQMFDFVRGQAEEVFPTISRFAFEDFFDGEGWFAGILYVENGEPVELFKANQSKILALYKLLIEIEEHRKVK